MSSEYPKLNPPVTRCAEIDPVAVVESAYRALHIKTDPIADEVLRMHLDTHDARTCLHCQEKAQKSGRMNYKVDGL